MAGKDRSTKLLEDYKDVFADIFNGLLFGKDVIDPDMLENGPTESVYKTESDETADQRRDVLKRYKDGYILICSMGIENQASVDNLMPIRIMNYDAATYMEQIKESKAQKKGNKDNKNNKNDKSVKIRIHPVITIVLNFSNTRWGKAKSLMDIMDVPNELKPYVSNYKIHVFDIAWLDDETINRFQSDFHVVADFFKQRRINKGYQSPAGVIEHVEEVMNLLSVFSGDSFYKESIPDILKIQQETEGGITMDNIHNYIKTTCLNIPKKVLEDFKKKVPIAEIAKKYDITEEYVQELVKLAASVTL